MRRSRAAISLMTCLFIAGACASDGGSSGTGITTAQGNIASAQAASLRQPRSDRRTVFARWLEYVLPETTAVADAGVGGITVTVGGTGISTATDPSGSFRLQGDFAGSFELLFTRAEDGLTASLEMSEPRGGTLTLADVHLDGPSGKASADRRMVDFEGVIVQTDCSQGTIQVVSRAAPDDGNRYTIHLANSPVTDDQGRSLSCGDLKVGSAIHARGDVRDDLGYDSESVEVKGEDSNHRG